ncbi:AbrB family transcriptional regulator [Lutimaribacter sp. EGI FJ00015]|uniref:AbrB family transcriptional regulator n=1 Tax=Lutimaribacter degradans TaxID=2945989 RepID=A0ACC5ZU45_9RHOB|nr:AbrB family transcriptional regulator [Lutimaribacter sp. EGI FJ00013]MCM2561645.1 AbrB family transcriptional regulator [Lutimaribacter sp. EGI FJ00013]MCO0612643.1 AbrB family transcriptional regulator [Lutimaribacter sp. EGI FJ00015]MCO0635301.1 AbrB family transcriptional regulator [Lutimaribacter sp. EGI FJ00014]
MTWSGILRRVVVLVAIYVGALLFGLVAHWMRFPLPWMIGAIVFASTVRLADRPLPVPGQTRQIGQILVATSVGLSFTPEAVGAMGSLLIPMIGAAILTIGLGFVVAVFLVRVSHIDFISALLASIPMGPVESATLAVRHNVLPGPVVFAQTLRIMLLVILIPPAIVALDGTVKDPVAALSRMEWTVSGAALLAVTGVAGALAARAVRLANPFFVGSLGGAALAAALSLPITAYPYPLLVLAQVFLGVWLGGVFDRELLRRARGFIPGAVLASFLLIFLCGAMGVGLTWITDETWQVMLLSTAPGSVTEMALTAKILEDGLAVVTAFHVVRIFIILPFSSPIIALTARMAARWGA